MARLAIFPVVCVSVAATAPAAEQGPTDPSAWTIYITNDNCPDYTWGLSEEQTRQAFADVVKGHLDEMQRTVVFHKVDERYTDEDVQQTIAGFRKVWEHYFGTG